MSEYDPPPGISIRPSTAGDAEGLHRALDVVARERRHIAMVEAPTIEQVRAFLSTLSARDVVQWIALSGSEVVGWCDVTRKSIEGFRHSATLGMGLLPAYRGQGLGGVLLHAVLRDAESQGVRRVELEVYTTNDPAIALYERFGFAREGVKRSARILDGRSQDILCMARLWPSSE